MPCYRFGSFNEELNMNKLIIWDFDGVIADSEKLWVSVWLETLKKKKILFFPKMKN